MHFPELVVSSRKFCRLRSRLRIGMHLAQGKVTEDKQQAFAEMLLYPFDDWIGVPARGALVIPVFYEGAGRIRISLLMILGTHRNGKLSHHFSNSSSACKIPSAPGLTRIGDRWLQVITPSLLITKSARSLKPAS